MKLFFVLVIASFLPRLTLAAGVIDETDAGRQAEQRSCIQCHSLRLVDTQTLSPAAWRKEVDKMIGWGAVVPDKELLIKYLSDHYGNTRTPPPPLRSADSK
jgi:cytochrome c-type biogenesis protein CcmH/NrfF